MQEGTTLARHSIASGRRAYSASPRVTGKRGCHRAEYDKSPVGNRVAAVAVVAGAFVTSIGAANGLDADATRIIPLAAGTDLAAALAADDVASASEAQIRTVHAVEPGLEAAKLMRSEALLARQHVDQAIRHASDAYNARQAELKRRQEAAAAEQARVAAAQAEEQARIAAEEAARRPKAVKPAEGAFTSGFGARWGTTHYGVDIANAIGTPILSAMSGVVVEAGPASGFGLWVRVQHEDGTITVYGHVNEILVAQGQQVRAGEQIATMGNRGQSTGPHLHFEVWVGGSQKIDPIGWLGERGINL
ncbi:M23 family metallopeptidase [Saccharothrix syringae]|uniref:M23 family metallopeptidase n=1 Tax=Saccharothrix syringae TaxID=103733 RepID=A0A5Q0H7M8_SACSY|nr:M23 family metallopeptidase [Saccharothrix syringae]